MTEEQFNEIVARQAQPPLGTSSQVKTDIGDLISEITRRVTGNTDTPAVPFEPEPLSDDTQEALRVIGVTSSTELSTAEMQQLREMDATFQAKKVPLDDRTSTIREMFSTSKKAAKKR